MLSLRWFIWRFIWSFIYFIILLNNSKLINLICISFIILLFSSILFFFFVVTLLTNADIWTFHPCIEAFTVFLPAECFFTLTSLFVSKHSTTSIWVTWITNRRCFRSCCKDNFDFRSECMWISAECIFSGFFDFSAIWACITAGNTFTSGWAECPMRETHTIQFEAFRISTFAALSVRRVFLIFYIKFL